MAAFVRTSFTNNYLTLPKGSPQRISTAVWPTGGNPGDGEKAQAALLRQPDFIIAGTTDTNTAVLNAGAAQSFMVNLSDEGVTFPAGFDRDIVIECWTRDEDGPNYQKIQQTVRGSATAPAATGGVRNLGPKVGGRITFATAAATAADAYGGFGITAAATATGRYAAAVPKARRLIPTTLHVTLVGTGDLSAVATSMHLNAATLATGVIELGFREGLDASVAPGDTVQAVFEADVLPVESCELGFDTTTTPDEVLVGALGQASETVSWLAHVYVGELRSNAATASSD
jgi:hypothetical protein